MRTEHYRQGFDSSTNTNFEEIFMNKRNKTILLILVLLLCMSILPVGYDAKSFQVLAAGSEYELVSNIDPEFVIDASGVITEIITDLKSENGNAYLCDIMIDGNPVAYTIHVDDVLVEYSLSPSPYSVYLNMNYENNLGYNYSQYYVSTSEGNVY